MRDLGAERPDTELFFITGADALDQILTWKDSEELFGLAHFVGVTRPGHRLDRAGLPPDRVSLMEVPAMAISSTDCRARVVAGDPVWYLRARRGRAVHRQAPPVPRGGGARVSEDTTATADLGDAGTRGERRRALQAERERQAQRQAERERQAQPEAGAATRGAGPAGGPPVCGDPA